MQLSIEHIEQEMTGEGLTPRQIVSFRTYLSALYSLKGAEMQKILAVKPRVWLQIRDGKKSDTAAERAWQAMEAGLLETKLKWDLKRIEKLLNALASMLRVMEGEARNQM